MKIVPVLMVRNEERFIADVLWPLVTVFGQVEVADTGSDDATVDIIRQIPGVNLAFHGLCSPDELTEVRRELGRRTQAAGADWQMLVDGDELYCVSTLRALVAEITAWPAHVTTGFTTMLTLDQDEQGAYWELNDLFNRQCILRPTEAWKGTYPFDTPHSFDEPSGFAYLSPPAPYRYHALHLHRLVRSSADDTVYLRTFKQRRFSMQERDITRGQAFDFAAWTEPVAEVQHDA